MKKKPEIKNTETATLYGTLYGKYTVYVDCKNCAKLQKIDIPKGQKIEETTCLNCGCKELFRQSS